MLENTSRQLQEETKHRRETWTENKSEAPAAGQRSGRKAAHPNRAPGHAKLPGGHLLGLKNGITKGGGSGTKETIMKYKAEGQGLPIFTKQAILLRYHLPDGFVRLQQQQRINSSSQGPFHLQQLREPGADLPKPRARLVLCSLQEVSFPRLINKQLPGFDPV